MANFARVIVTQDPLETLIRCGGYYATPKNVSGNRLGPLVGYAGAYLKDGKRCHYVGEEYFNFARVEQHPRVLRYFAACLAERCANTEIGHGFTANTVLAAPMGGIFLGLQVGILLNARTIYAEKHVVQAATRNEREVSELVLARHKINPDDRVLIVEDVCSSFSTAMLLAEFVAERKANLLAVACAVNRSGESSMYGVPVVSVIEQPTKQYRQDDSFVREEVERMNIFWKPKEEWDKLLAVMRRALRKE
jgi:orotate phosphoribosyltransferase